MAAHQGAAISADGLIRSVAVGTSARKAASACGHSAQRRQPNTRLAVISAAPAAAIQASVRQRPQNT